MRWAGYVALLEMLRGFWLANLKKPSTMKA